MRSHWCPLAVSASGAPTYVVKRHPEVGANARLDAREPRGRDPDDLELLLSKAIHLPTMPRVTAEAAQPEAVAQHRDTVRAGLVLVAGYEETTGGR